jgi:hypothetical protein
MLVLPVLQSMLDSGWICLCQSTLSYARLWSYVRFCFLTRLQCIFAYLSLFLGLHFFSFKFCTELVFFCWSVLWLLVSWTVFVCVSITRKLPFFHQNLLKRSSRDYSPMCRVVQRSVRQKIQKESSNSLFNFFFIFWNKYV